jgi:aspartate carbamoyltransferase regulatory subunit
MLSEKKQELQVAALENGTVIDHIPSDDKRGLEHNLCPYRDRSKRVARATRRYL